MCEFIPEANTTAPDGSGTPLVELRLNSAGGIATLEAHDSQDCEAQVQTVE